MDSSVYTLIDGSAPVLLSAPHSFAHKRPSMRGVLKHGEPGTDYIVKKVCEETGAFGVYLNEPSVEFDPNFNKIESNEYKGAIKDLFETKKIEAVIDLHGLNEKIEYDFQIFYCVRFSRSRKLAMQLMGEMGKQKELKGCSYHVGYTPRNSQETITEYVCEGLRYPAIQVEIARYIREDPVLLSAVVAGLTAFVKSI
ncbi:hypothetical protein IT417_03215 [bacterium]|nr:hypothetical protein [bacterium]